MLTTPEKEKQTPEKTGIGEENATPEAERQSGKHDTPRKEELKNEEACDYLPTQPNGPETDTQKDTQKKQEGEQSAMESIASEQSERTPRTEHTVQSEIWKV